MHRGERASLPRPVLMLVTDSTRRPARAHEGEEWLDDVVREAVLGGVNIVQLREKHLPTVDLIKLGLHVRDVIADRALLVVNGDLEATRMLRADAIHLPSNGPTIRAVRAELGDSTLISRAVHSAEEAVRAQDEGADFIVLGTVFETASKPGVRPIGLDAVCEVCARVRIPVIAIGGIDASNAAAVLRAGAAGIAVIGAVMDAHDPRAAASELRTAIDGVRVHNTPAAGAGA